MTIRAVVEGLAGLLYRIARAGAKTEFSLGRFKMYDSLRSSVRENAIRFEGPVLSISHSTHLCPILGAGGLPMTQANFPDASIFQLPFPDSSFGLVVSDQVFEHIEGLPSDAMRETLRVVRKGGWVLHTTCFTLPYHGPGDYWRFTPEGLRYLALKCGASEALAEGRGHPIEALFNYLGWRHQPVPVAKWHPLRRIASINRDSYASMVWVLARK